MMGEVIRVSGRAPDVGEFLREAMLSQRFADVALCCPGGQRFLAHRLVLSAASPYLQEVLLAHSKSAAHCEPITVILAEVEAPELAAILGFVYTGSATVPRARLDAFLRAAEALHIRLPPVPVVMTCTDAECKQEDVKDVKISPKYLHCDQYPTCERWHRSGGLAHADGPASKKESYPGTSTNEPCELARDVRPLPDSTNLPRSRYSPSRLHCPWPVPFAGVEQDRRTQQRIDHALEKERAMSMDVRRYHPASVIPRIERSAELPDKSPGSTLAPVCDSSINPCQQKDACLAGEFLDARGRLDPLELRLRSEYGQLQATGYAAGKFAYEDAPERVATTNEPLSESDRVREHRVGVIRTRDGTLQSRATSLQYTGRTRSYEKPDYGQTGEDLSCGESCCRWRTPRRHVANRVTASPWRQIIRPHHSPKIRPIVPQSQADEAEAGESVRVPETQRSTASSGSPSQQSPKNAAANDGFYGFDVPTGCEPGFGSNARPIEAEARLQTFYAPQLPFPPNPQAAATVPTANTVRANETFYPTTSSVVSAPARSSPVAVDGATTLSVNKKDAYVGQPVAQTTSKPELSHPVSRLCDTIESNDKSEGFSASEAKKPEVKMQVEEKVAGRIFINSDSNNNDSIVSTDAPQRGKSGSGQEDHRCDQCGKTFVTRASLKVHSRTHSGEKPFRCADCGKQFSQLRNYKYHRSVHEGTREFAATCPECGKYFNDRGYLSSHMKIHRNRKEYGCAECGKSFNQRVAYNMHVRIHTGVKPHQCEQCGKAFSRKMLLKQHLRTHSGERPYQCQVCQKAFADRSNMTLHTRLHSGLKPYQCTLCSKAFTKKHHLKTHLNYHTGTKPYSCPNCGLRFSQSSNMRTHFKKCTVNNPAGAKSMQNEGGALDSAKGVDVQVIPRTPTDALTPPNSDQESSILTPISKTVGVEANVT